MQIEHKIGQLLIIGLPTTHIDPATRELLEQIQPGGVLLDKANIESAQQVVELTSQIRSIIKVPPLIAIDQEGGKVNRLKDKYGFPRSITAQEMGKAATLDSVKFYAESIASNLAGLGINVNFAPVVDLAVNKNNTVIYKPGRSFGTNPDSVALFAHEFIKPHRRFGVTTVLKHFPGHGSSVADTHYGVADVTHTWTSQELVPYQRLLAGGDVDAIMSAHIVNKQLDPKGLPGTL